MTYVGERAQRHVMGLGLESKITSRPKRIKGSTACPLGKHATREGRTLRPKRTWPVRGDPVHRIYSELDQVGTLKIPLQGLSFGHA